MLAARKLHFGNFVDDAPLIYATLVKSALFAVVLAVFRILEEAVGGFIAGDLSTRYTMHSLLKVPDNAYRHFDHILQF